MSWGRRWAALAGAAILAGCSTPPPATQSATPTVQAVPAVIDFCRDRVRAEWSLRRRVVHLAGCEWIAWGEQRLLLEQGEWPEAQVEFGPDEDALTVWSRVAEYWDVADPGHAREVRALAAQAPRRELWPAWRRAWSAAFVSWVMRRSGSPDFTPDPAHADYLRAALARRPDSVVDLAGYQPVSGDVICAGRGSGPRTAEEFLRRLRDEQGFFPSHCDIIADVRANAITLIGGNVKNAVTATVTSAVRNDAGEIRIPPASTRPWAVALRLAEPPDPCASLAPGPGC